ncbi:dynamin-related protein 3A-like [Cucumis melo var. makuwa]|uniref:Dynamin-related protein 3A-like n=1 Tax=Cucumis melo var. makuwa TaxID=1194695 RepID=A0A5A7TQZ1_CUCMM|nr:dynamin-related protein 3A-like [Cucumis melo var. makuwa]
MADDPVAPSMPSVSSSSAAPLGSSVIPIVNKLQDIFAQLGSQSTIELPQVAVVGSQSSGKSSVLEALVGRDFLPRGSGICTRRPLVLQLLQTNTDKEYGEFLHLPGKKFYDFSEIRREIQSETEREVGGNKGVSDKQIRLKIFSPNVLDITLVDLPGITKVPVGDQPSDIEARIRTMIMSYIKVPSCLILAVTPANSDLANSDALQIAGNADPDGELDIMDRGTDARNLLLGKVIPLRLGYVGVVNRSQEDILLNRSIKDALVDEEKFFRTHPVLVQHIKAVFPGLKSRISAALVSVAKEHASYGEITESKAGQGALLLNILSKYCEAFCSMVEGKNEKSTNKLLGGARIHYIFQSIYVKSLEEVDPCEDLTDDDIRTAIQNATGPKSAVFVPDVPFEVLIRRQIIRLLDPSLQCARFIYDELVEISHRCLTNELQRFPVLRKRIDEVIGNFLREGLEPSETIIGHLINIEMGYINTSHPNFIGGSKAVEMALQQVKSSRVPSTVPRLKDGVVEPDKAPPSEKTSKSRAFLARHSNGFLTEKPSYQTVPDPSLLSVDDFSGATANNSSWGISSIFGGSDNRTSAKESSTSKPYNEHVLNTEQSFSMIHLREPPLVLRPSGGCTEQEAIEIAVIKLLLRSYYDIVRNNIKDLVPKSIMHFLVNHTKQEMHNVFIKKLYRENLFEEMLQEPDEVAMKRKHTRETLRVLQQAFRTLDELPLEAESVERGDDPTGLPKMHGMPTSSMYSTTSSNDSFSPSPKNPKPRKSSYSGELQVPVYGNSDSNGNGRSFMPSLYPKLDL